MAASKAPDAIARRLLASILLRLERLTALNIPHHQGNWFMHDGSQIYCEELVRYAKLKWTGKCRPGSIPALPGDIALFRTTASRYRYNHAAIVTAWPRALHAFDKVIESRPALLPLTSYADMQLYSPWGD